MAAEVSNQRAASFTLAALGVFGPSVLQGSSSPQPADKADTNAAEQNGTGGGNGGNGYLHGHRATIVGRGHANGIIIKPKSKFSSFIAGELTAPSNYPVPGGLWEKVSIAPVLLVWVQTYKSNKFTVVSLI
jgi:hypothetical protein